MIRRIARAWPYTPWRELLLPRWSICRRYAPFPPCDDLAIIRRMSDWHQLLFAVLGASLPLAAAIPLTDGRVRRLMRALRFERSDNARLRAELERLRTSQTVSGVGTWDWRVDTDSLHWSDEVFPMFGFRPGEVVPSYALFCAMLHPEDAARVREGEIACVAGNGPHDQEYRVVWGDGTVRWLRETGGIIRDVSRRPIRMIGTVRDITEDKLREQRMLHLAFHDELTGLPNRAYFQVRMDDALARSRRSGSMTALAFIDLDRFKPINDIHGHAVGDAALVAVATRLKEALRDGDCVARLGGDEFVAILEGLEAREEAEAVAAKLLAALRRPVLVEELRLDLDASIGIALYPGDGDDGEALLQAADRAMYRTKGRETV